MEKCNSAAPLKQASVMRVYLDNMMASVLDVNDLFDVGERQAFSQLLLLAESGKIEFVISAEVHRELGRTSDVAQRARCKEVVRDLENVRSDHKVLGFQNQDLGYRGFISSPLVTDIIDEAMLAKLIRMGLKRRDATHLINAVHDRCDVFFTTDPDFLDRCSAIKAIWPSTRIKKPSELLTEISQADTP